MSYPKIYDRVVQKTQSTASPFVFSESVDGYHDFADVYSDSDPLQFVVADGVNFEVWEGTYAAATGLTGVTLLDSSNGGAAVTWPSGDKFIFASFTKNLLDRLAFTEALAADLIPDANNTRDIGSAAKKFKNAYLAGALTVATITVATIVASGAVATGDLTVTGNIVASGNITTLGIDDDATQETLQINDNSLKFGGTPASAFQVSKIDGDSILQIGGGSTTGLGANMVFWGEGHAATGDIQFRKDTTVTLQYDWSASLYDFQANDIVTDGQVGFGFNPVDYIYTLIKPSNFISGGSSTTAEILRVSGQLTGVAGDTGLLCTTRIFSDGIVTQGTGDTIADIASLIIVEPNITNTGGADTITNASTLLITGAPTEGVNNFAILIDGGDSWFEGDLRVAGGVLGVGKSDTLKGAISLFGSGTGSAAGGELYLYTAADYDATINYFLIDAEQDDLRILESTATYVSTFQGNNGEWILPSNLTIGNITTGAGFILCRGITPGIKMRESDGTTTHNESYIVQNGDSLSFQTRDDSSVFVATDYSQVKSTSGATIHRWYIDNVVKMRLDTNGGLILGANITPDGTLHVHTNSAGTVTADATADDLVIENNTSAGLTILTPNTNFGRINFGDPEDANVCEIRYEHSNNDLAFIVNSIESVRFDSQGYVGIGEANPLNPLHITTSERGLIWLESTNTGAVAGPTITFHRNSASPAASDDIGALFFDGETTTGAQATYAQMVTGILDPTNGSHDGKIEFDTAVAGSIANRMIIANGAYMAGATGGDKGANAFNASEIFDDGTNLNIQWVEFELVAPTDSCATATGIKTFTFPFDGVFLQDDTDLYQLAIVCDTAGTTGVMTVDIHKNGTTIMTTNKLEIDSGETSSATAAVQPDLTTTTFSAGDTISIDIDTVHTTPALGLRIMIGFKRTSNG